ncbi:MAG: hypothetical protein AVDCRST_MAG50-2575 [uncultured Acidimicrobiales bacterium]|uniref:Endonuclease/exonuclease/phosphatase domain-containing protein n=1 Tax=uncultured Acidimicrobiales bacterium TaxID=310071 RepID=A0A6J4IQ38_9ACTN|nr:MAG: hypothetical protein AVDCRST_MAG50-2575 [uncultured Acidimicrobiales bacterium]
MLMVAREIGAASAPYRSGATTAATAPGRRRRHPLARVAALAALAAPWSWFVVRDRGELFDAAAIGMPLVVPALVGLLLVAAVIRPLRRMGLAAAASALVVGAVVVVAPWTPQGSPVPEPAVRVASANVLLRNTQAAAAAAAIIDIDADVVVSLETRGDIGGVLDRAYRYGSTSDRELSQRIYARWPVVEMERLPGRLAPHGLRAVIDRPGGRFVVYGVHLPRPWLDSSRTSVPVEVHTELVAALADLVRAETLPAVLAGDLNLVDRSSGYRSLDAFLRDAVRTEWAGPTSLKRRVRFLLPRIDHIFVTEGWCAEGGGRFNVPGSDHKGVVAAVGPCPAPDRSS